MLKSLLPFVLLAAAIPFAPAHADDPVLAEVNYADLDLASRADVVRLDRRLSRAIESVCAQTQVATTARFNHRISRCRTEKLNAIAAQRDAAIASAHRSAALAAEASRTDVERPANH